MGEAAARQPSGGIGLPWSLRMVGAGPDKPGNPAPGPSPSPKPKLRPSAAPRLAWKPSGAGLGIRAPDQARTKAGQARHCVVCGSRLFSIVELRSILEADMLSALVQKHQRHQWLTRRVVGMSYAGLRLS